MAMVQFSLIVSVVRELGAHYGQHNGLVYDTGLSIVLLCAGTHVTPYSEGE